jgi:hypothetical protein
MIRIDKFSNRRLDSSRSKNNCKPFFAPQSSQIAALNRELFEPVRRPSAKIDSRLDFPAKNDEVGLGIAVFAPKT